MAVIITMHPFVVIILAKVKVTKIASITVEIVRLLNMIHKATRAGGCLRNASCLSEKAVMSGRVFNPEHPRPVGMKFALSGKSS